VAGVVEAAEGELGAGDATHALGYGLGELFGEAAAGVEQDEDGGHSAGA